VQLLAYNPDLALAKYEQSHESLYLNTGNQWCADHIRGFLEETRRYRWYNLSDVQQRLGRQPTELSLIAHLKTEDWKTAHVYGSTREWDQRLSQQNVQYRRNEYRYLTVIALCKIDRWDEAEDLLAKSPRYTKNPLHRVSALRG